MRRQPKREEIDHRTLKLIVGLIALSLASLASYFAEVRLESISASYYEKDWSRTIFTGFLFAIAAFFLAYNGFFTREAVLSKAGALAALGVAMFPCKCGSHDEVLPYVHALSAALLFVILACFCYIFRQRAVNKGHPQARTRAVVYSVCGVVIVGVIVVLGLDGLTGERLARLYPRATFFGEALGLVAFGISWLTASRILPGLARSDERLFSNDDQEKR